ncbi:MAG: [LysW]-aminoadipate kinase [Euryarchaeota archaeon]|nr:[LysW]-aminoadipate kinase [Euryarchaeota archaeon]
MIVVKIGGAVGINYDLVLKDLVKYEAVLVHGGSGEMNRVSEKLGKPPKMIRSPSGHVSRRTDRDTLEIFSMVYCGKMNKMIVGKLQRLGVNAVGLSGIDGGLLRGKRKKAIIAVENGKKKAIHDDYTGKVEKVNVDLIKMLIENGYMPVITPPALSYENETINVDGDRAAARIAGALEAEVLIILSNIPGLLRDPEDETSLIREIEKKRINEAMSYAEGRMKKKVMGATEALEVGVEKVLFGDARVENPITKTIEGKGTVIQ